MGHYCKECGEKLVGGVVAKTCSCAECFCSRCWENLFMDGYEKSNKTYYYYEVNGELVKETKELYFPTDTDCGYCKDCGMSYGGVDNWDYY